MSTPSPLGPNRTALVTGGSSGIGLALAKQLAQLGCHVWLAARREELLQAAIKEMEGVRLSPVQRFGYTPADLSDPAQALLVAEQVTQAIGLPDVLINSAATAESGYVYELPTEAFKRQIEINYLGTVYMVKALLPDMMQRRSGTIVNITSMAGAIGLYGYTAYGASKFAVCGFSEALRSEMKPYDVRVVLVYPPDTDTPQLAEDIKTRPPETSAFTAAASVQKPDDVAREIIQSIQRGRTLVIPGLDSKVLHRLVGLLGDALFPLIDFLIARARKKNPPSPTVGEEP